MFEHNYILNLEIKNIDMLWSLIIIKIISLSITIILFYELDIELKY